MSPDVLIVGGGLAGLAAAHRLLEEDLDVTLVEKRDRLGGRASSYELDEFPIEIDNCQHLLTGSCRHCLGLIRDLVGEDALESVRELPVATQKGVRRVRPVDLPVPLHLFPYLRGFSDSLPETLKAGSRLLSLRFASPENFSTAADWLRDHQPMSLIKNFWWPLTVSALNETPDRLDLRVFQKWVFTGLVDYEEATTLYFPDLSLKGLYSRRLGGALAEKGLDLHRNTRVQRIDPEKPAAQLDSGEWIEPERLISALPDRVLWARLTEEYRNAPPYNRIPEWEHAPIVSVHLLVEGNWELPKFLLLASRDAGSFEWMFAPRQPEGDQTYAQFVKSAAYEMSSQDKEPLRRRALKRLRELVGRQPNRLATQVVKEKNATLSLTPSTFLEQFGPTTPEDDFYVAGDWTRGGWPPTMEAAVRSGYRAAEAARDRSSNPMKDPQPAGLFRQFQSFSMRG